MMDRLRAAIANANGPTAKTYKFEDGDEKRVINYPEKPIEELYSIAQARANDILNCDLDIAELEKQKTECSDILFRCQHEIDKRLQVIHMSAAYKGKVSTPPPVPAEEE